MKSPSKTALFINEETETKEIRDRNRRIPCEWSREK
jgi:hypothetical protein